MADFAPIKDRDLWINLDLVVRIEPGIDDTKSRSVVFIDGSTLTLSEADSKRLLKSFRPKKKKKKGKKKATGARGTEADATHEAFGQPTDILA